MADLPRIVFFGTPDIAVASLNAIVKAGYPVRGAVTAPDMPAGRGLKIKASPVKDYAERRNIEVAQPPDLTSKEFIRLLQEWKPDIQVVVAFRLLPKEVWTLPAMGTFNLHASLLPQYRGAAPINRVLINGETETGVTTFFLQEKVDTGNIILQEKTPVHPDETAGELHDRLMHLGSEAVVRTLEMIASRDVRLISQDQLMGPGTLLKKAPKIHKEDCRIKWDQDVFSVHNQIRGLSPHPAGFSVFAGNDGQDYYLKIFRSKPEQEEHTYSPGTVITDGKTFFRIAARNGFTSLLHVQVSGRKAMAVGEFLHGFGRHFV